jgi:hypothetical protein
MNQYNKKRWISKLRAAGCKVEYPYSGDQEVVCRVVIPDRSLSDSELNYIFGLVMQGGEDKATGDQEMHHRSHTVRAGS